MTEKDQIMFTAFCLKRKYTKMVANRLRRKSWCGKTSPKPIASVAMRLKDPKLASLFVEAQFGFMPIEFCKNAFGVIYPPVNVAFGGKCWERYDWYINRGVRDGC